MKYRVRQGAILNHNSQICRGGDVVDLEPHVAADAAVIGSIEEVKEDEPVVAPKSEKEKK